MMTSTDRIIRLQLDVGDLKRNHERQSLIISKLFRFMNNVNKVRNGFTLYCVLKDVEELIEKNQPHLKR